MGHNPVGAVFILLLLGLLAIVSVSGILLATTGWQGNELLKVLHRWCAFAILHAVGLHVLMALLESAQHHENLIKSMFTGSKREPAATDVDDKSP